MSFSTTVAHLSAFPRICIKVYTCECYSLTSTIRLFQMLPKHPHAASLSYHSKHNFSLYQRVDLITPIRIFFFVVRASRERCGWFAANTRRLYKLRVLSSSCADAGLPIWSEDFVQALQLNRKRARDTSQL